MTDRDSALLRRALAQARKSLDEGGVPVGAVLARADEVVAEGHNQRVQRGDPTAHGEMDCLRNAGRRTDYRQLTLYTTLSPCMMCTGTILQLKIGRVVVGEDVNFAGNVDLLRERGVEVILADDAACIEMMAGFIRDHPELWNEDIAE